MIVRYALLHGHPPQMDGTLRKAEIKLPDDCKTSLTVESLFSAIRDGHFNMCFAEPCSAQYVMLETIISTTSLQPASATHADVLNEEEKLDPQQQIRNIARRLFAGCHLVVFYVPRASVNGDPSHSTLADGALPADRSSPTVQKRPRSPDKSDSNRVIRPSPLSLEQSTYYANGEKITIFAAINRDSKDFSLASNFETLLHNQNTVLIDFSLIIGDIETALVRGTSTKVVLFNHYESVPMGLLRSMLERHHDILEEPKSSDKALKGLAIRTTPNLLPQVGSLREKCLVLPIIFSPLTGLTDGMAKATLTTEILKALWSFGKTYRKYLGNSDIALHDDDVLESIQGALSLVQRFAPGCFVVVTIKDFDAPATDMWLGRLEGSRSVNLTEHGLCRWISANFLAPLVTSPVVARVYGFSRTSGMMEAIQTPLFPIRDLSSLPSFQDLCSPRVAIGKALLSWVYRKPNGGSPDKKTLGDRHQELLEISGTSWANRNDATVSLEPRLTKDPTSNRYLSLGISSDIERAIAIGLCRMEPDQRNKLEDSSIHSGAPPFLVNVDRQFCYSDIPPRQLVQAGSATSGASHLVEGSRKDPVSNLLLSLGLLLALTDRALDGTCKVVFANTQAKQLILEVFRTRMTTIEQTTYSHDPVDMSRRLEKYYQSLPLTMTRDLQENSFHLMFKERLDSRDMYVGHLLSLPELRLKKGPIDRGLNDALNKQTSNLYVDYYEPEEGAVHELKVANATNVYAGTVDDINPSTFQLRTFITDKIDPIMENEWPDANHWENKAEVDLTAELKANGGRPGYRKYSANLYWTDLIVKYRSRNKDCYERVDTRFRKGIAQVREYQELVAAGETMIVDGKVLGGTSPEGIEWSVIESRTTGENTVIRAYIWMLLCGKYIIHYQLPSIEKAHRFHRA
ncbi:hypothetical protein CPB85DRAFT_1280184 [Mucidula mucida]|nr:hypothetical protein CPB85DRAFT_1280184 [Mucidula mucida]